MLTRRSIFAAPAVLVTVPAIAGPRPSTIVGMIAELESRFKVYPEDGLHGLAPTGEPYVAICSGGIKPEGKPLKSFPAKEDAINSWIDSVFDYMRGKSDATLYWRERPQIDWNGKSLYLINYIPNEGYAVYSRFLISSMPHREFR